MAEKKYKMHNTRAYPRLKASYLVKYMLSDAGSGHEITGTANTRDISPGGLRFWLNESFPKNALVRLQILIPPAGQSISAFAKVVRVEPEGQENIHSVSLSFLEISKEDQQTLRDLIERIAGSPDRHRLIDDADVSVRKIKE